MVQVSQNTAILVFVRSEVEEVANKTFYRSVGRRGNLRIAKYFNQTIVQTVDQTGLPYFVMASDQQKGRSFGERFTHAIQSVFDKGFDKVIAVGNDCLTLTKRRLSEAEKALQTTRLVLGPAQDGGVYLFGIHKSIFDPKKLEALPWQKSNLFQAIGQFFEKKGLTPILLQAELDIDSNEDFKSVVFQLAPRSIRFQILILLGLFLAIAESRGIFLRALIDFKVPSLRGPPSARLILS